RVFRAVVMALDRDMRHRPLQVVLVDAVPGGIGGGELGEVARRRRVGPEEVVDGAAVTLRQAAVTGILQLLDAEREGDVAGPGGNRVNGAAEGFRAACAVVFNAR